MEDKSEDDKVYEVENIIDKRSRRGKIQYLLKWKDYSKKHNSWEPLENLFDSAELIQEFENKIKLKSLRPGYSLRPNDAKISSMSPEREFKINDLVFAKLKYNRPWPARIIAILSDVRSKIKYKVNYYGGAGQISYVDFKNLILYDEESRLKLGRNLRNIRHFAQALKEVEREYNRRKKCLSSQRVGQESETSDENNDYQNVAGTSNYSRPEQNLKTKGVVNQTSDNDVSYLVQNSSNASIVRPENQPCDQCSGSTIKKDDTINVKVVSNDLTQKFPDITEEMIVNEIDEREIFNNVQDEYSEKSSSSEERDFITSVERGGNNYANTPLQHFSSDIESSNEELDISIVDSSSMSNNIKIDQQCPVLSDFGISGDDQGQNNLSYHIDQNISKVEDTKSLNEKTKTQKSSGSFSSDDDELYTIPKQNILKKLYKKSSTVKTQNRKCYNRNSSNNERNSSDKHDETSSDSTSETNNSNKKKTSGILSNDSESNHEMEHTSNENNTDEYQLISQNVSKYLSHKAQTSNAKIQETKREKLTGKKKKGVLKKSRTRIEELKPNIENLSTDDGTDDENDLIKKIAEERKLNLSEKTDILEAIFNNQNKLKKHTKSLDIKFDQNTSRNSIEKPKPNISTVNTSQIDVPLQTQMQFQTDNSSDDENDLIKKIAEKRKLNLSEKPESSEASNKKRLKKHKKLSDTKFVKKSSEITIKTNQPVIVKKFRNTIEKAKPNTSNVNISRIDVPLQTQMQFQTDNSSDDENDLIKKNCRKKKLNLSEKPESSEASNKKRLKKHKKL